MKLDIQTFSQSHIDCLVDGGAEYGWWHLTGFYGNPKTSKRKEKWDTMKHLGTNSSLPWLVIGDFNEIMSMLKKEGGSSRPRQQLANFVETINLCGCGTLASWDQDSYGFMRQGMAGKLEKGLTVP